MANASNPNDGPCGSCKSYLCAGCNNPPFKHDKRWLRSNMDWVAMGMAIGAVLMAVVIVSFLAVHMQYRQSPRGGQQTSGSMWGP
jgi:hypothetical protein